MCFTFFSSTGHCVFGKLVTKPPLHLFPPRPDVSLAAIRGHENILLYFSFLDLKDGKTCVLLFPEES